MRCISAGTNMLNTERERRMAMLRAALPYTAGSHRQALEMLLQADALLTVARRSPENNLEACSLPPDPEEMLLHMQEYCTPRESDLIQIMLNFMKAGHLFQNYREFLLSRNHSPLSGETEAAGFTPNMANPFGMLLQMIGGLGNMNNSGNLLEFLMTQLSPEQKQFFEQMSAPPTQENHEAPAEGEA